MPGCDCENSNFQIAYEEQTSVVRQLHPDWSDREVRVDVAQFLRPKFLQDLDSRNAERHGIEKSEPIEFQLTQDGTDIVFTKYGRTLSELNERTRTLTPEQYNPVDAITNAAIISAIKQGAGRIVTSYWRPNGDNRDLLEISFNAKTGLGTSRTINTEALSGKTYKYEDLSTHAKSLFQDLQFQKPDEKVFLATDISLDISQMQQAIQENDSQKFDAISDIAQSGMESADRIVEDVKVTIASVIDYVRDQKSSESIIEPYFTNTTQDYFTYATNEIRLDWPEYNQSEIIHSFETVFGLLDGTFGNDVLVELSTTPDIDETTINFQELWIQRATESLSISKSEASLLLTTTSKLYEMFTEQHDSLQIVEMFEVGHGAIFFALETFTMSELHAPQNEGTEHGFENSDVSVFGREFSEEQTAEIFSVLLATPVLESMRDKPIEQQIKILQGLNLPEYVTDIDLVHFLQVIEFIQVLDKSPSEQKIELIKTEQQKFIEKIHALHHAIVEVVTNRSTQHEKTSRYSEFMQINQEQFDESVSKELDVHIENFSLALSFWMMFKLIQYVSILQNIETNIKKQQPSYESESTHLLTNASEQLNRENGSEFIQKEPAPWLLFAIIWQLAMIREQGFAQTASASTPATKSQISKKKKSNSQQGSIRIPRFFDIPTGVIYAFNHAMIEV